MNVLKTYQKSKHCFNFFLNLPSTSRFITSRAYDVASNIIYNFTVKPTTNWECLRKEICDSNRDINPVNVHSIILDYFLRKGKISEAFNYVDNVKENTTKLPIAVIGRLFRIYVTLSDQVTLSDTQEKEIFDLYNAVKAEYKVLDTFTNEAMISALCKTKYWESSFPALKEIKLASNPSDKVYGGIVSAAFRNKNYSVGWHLVDEVIALDRELTEDCYLSYLESLTENGVIKDFERLEKLFVFLEQNDICSPKSFVYKLQECAAKTKLDYKFNFISKNGNCFNCNQQITKTDLTEIEFKLLKETFLNKVIVGKDVFRKTTPAEFHVFQEFIKKGDKYDVIIDGLNVAYSFGTKSRNHAQSIASVLDYFVTKKKKVLIVGRQHMNRWSPKYLAYIKKYSDLFLTEDMSQDDPYLLYCALNSGKDTILVTRDLMRSHSFILKDIYLQRLFKRWISQSRYELITITRENRCIFKQPLPYLRTAQKLGDYWHIFHKDSEGQECLCLKTKI